MSFQTPITVSQAIENIERKPKTDDEFLENLLSTRKDDPMAFSILSLLSPSLGNEEWRFEKDHLHPKAGFTKENLHTSGMPDDELEFCLDETHFDSLPNLHLLAERENRSKQGQPLVAWLTQRVKETGLSEADLRLRSLIPVGMSLDLRDFKSFYLARKDELKNRLNLSLEMKA